MAAIKMLKTVTLPMRGKLNASEVYSENTMPVDEMAALVKNGYAVWDVPPPPDVEPVKADEKPGIIRQIVQAVMPSDEIKHTDIAEKPRRGRPRKDRE